MKSESKWRAHGKISGTPHHLGLFTSEVEAAKRYDSFIIQHGLDKPLNFSKRRRYPYICRILKLCHF
jgi:hypothetical protein